MRLMVIVRIVEMSMHCSRTILPQTDRKWSTTKMATLSRARRPDRVSISYDFPNQQPIV